MGRALALARLLVILACVYDASASTLAEHPDYIACQNSPSTCFQLYANPPTNHRLREEGLSWPRDCALLIGLACARGARRAALSLNCLSNPPASITVAAIPPAACCSAALSPCCPLLLLPYRHADPSVPTR